MMRDHVLQGQYPRALNVLVEIKYILLIINVLFIHQLMQ